MTKADAKAQYFARIRENPIAAIVKLIDRCNNVSTMATAFSKDRMIRYIDETEQYILPMIDHVKHTWEEYYDAVFLLNYQIRSLLETQKRLL
jgi:GTP pyrophosphokinase